MSGKQREHSVKQNKRKENIENIQNSKEICETGVKRGKTRAGKSRLTLGFRSARLIDWLRRRREFFKPITERVKQTKLNAK